MMIPDFYFLLLGVVGFRPEYLYWTIVFTWTLLWASCAVSLLRLKINLNLGACSATPFAPKHHSRSMRMLGSAMICRSSRHSRRCSRKHRVFYQKARNCRRRRKVLEDSKTQSECEGGSYQHHGAEEPPHDPTASTHLERASLRRQ